MIMAITLISFFLFPILAVRTLSKIDKAIEIDDWIPRLSGSIYLYSSKVSMYTRAIRKNDWREFGLNKDYSNELDLFDYLIAWGCFVSFRLFILMSFIQLFFKPFPINRG